MRYLPDTRETRRRKRERERERLILPSSLSLAGWSHDEAHRPVRPRGQLCELGAVEISNFSASRGAVSVKRRTRVEITFAHLELYPSYSRRCTRSGDVFSLFLPLSKLARARARAPHNTHRVLSVRYRKSPHLP